MEHERIRAARTITALAQWRRSAYEHVIAEMTSVLESHCRTHSREQTAPIPSHVLSLCYVVRRGSPEREEQSAIALLAMPSVLLERADSEVREVLRICK